MRALIQRVSRASARIFDGRAGAAAISRDIGRGLAVLIGVGAADDDRTALRLAGKCARLRVFPDEAGRFSRSLLDVGGEALIVSQFTLYGDCSGGRRPDFTAAMPPARAEPLYRAFVSAFESLGVRCRTGEFGARMEVELVNDGPVTLWIDTNVR